MVITVGWKGQPISPLQTYSLLDPTTMSLPGACKREGLSIPPWQVHFTTMCSHQVQASVPFRSKMFKIWRHARTGTAFIRLVGILLFRGKFQILAAKETAYVRAVGAASFQLVGTRGKRSSLSNLVTVHEKTVTDDERDLSGACAVCLLQYIYIRKPYVRQLPCLQCLLSVLTVGDLQLFSILNFYCNFNFNFHI